MEEEWEEQRDVAETAESTETAEPAPKTKKVGREIGSWIVILIVAALLAWLITEFVIFSATVPSGSMEDTIASGSRIIGFRLSYVFDEPERGDIIIFRYPVHEEEYYIKRIIGLPGETVTIADGKIYINGSDTPLEEDYLKEDWVIRNDGLTYVVPEGCYFVLGDNRNVSQDSRYWAEIALRMGIASDAEEAYLFSFVREDLILAKAIFEYHPHLRSFV